MLHNENEEFPANSHGLGFELNQMFYMDALSSPTTAGHTGYTGTSIVIDRESRSFVILLTNRVHPSRNWGSNNVARRAVARDMAMAIPVKPQHGPTAWFSGIGDARTATLTVPVKLGAAPSRLNFDLWYDTEKTDVVVLESSSDGGSTWQELTRWSGWSGKKWGKASVDLDGLTGDVAAAMAVHVRHAVPRPRCLRRRHPRDVAGTHRVRRLPSAGRRCGSACGLVGSQVLSGGNRPGCESGLVTPPALVISVHGRSREC